MLKTIKSWLFPEVKVEWPIQEKVVVVKKAAAKKKPSAKKTVAKKPAAKKTVKKNTKKKPVKTVKKASKALMISIEDKCEMPDCTIKAEKLTSTESKIIQICGDCYQAKYKS